jgi:hypothetical protein
MMLTVGALALIVASTSVQPQVAPPKGGSWKTTADEGVADATKRNVPVLIYVAYAGPAADLQTKSFEDPAVVRLLGHFSCVFLAKEYDLSKFQDSYEPWVCPTVEGKYKPPLLNFGTAKDGPRKDLRVEGVGLDTGELVAELEKVLGALAPAAARKLKVDKLDQSKLPEALKLLAEAMGGVESTLSEATLAKFKEELSWTLTVAKGAEAKATKELKDPDTKKKASGLLVDLKKDLSALDKFKGKDPDKFKDSLQKARDKVRALNELQP